MTRPGLLLLVITMAATAYLVVRQLRAQAACEQQQPPCSVGASRVLFHDSCVCLPDLPTSYWP